MSGLAIVASPAFGDTALPVFRPHMLQIPGALALSDPAFSGSPWAAGVPANGSTVENLCWEEAAAVIGSGDATTLALDFQDLHQPGNAIYERTAKGALHTIYSQGSNANTRGGGIKLPTAIRTRIRTNPNNDYFVARVVKPTRAAIISGSNNTSGWGHIGSSGNIATQYLERMEPDGIRPLTGNLIGSTHEDIDGAQVGLNAVDTPTLWAVGTAGWTSTVPANDTYDAFLAGFGNFGIWATVTTQRCPSGVHYMQWLVDMTAAGLTYAELLEMAREMFRRDFGAGGRFEGDTYTAVSALP